ncbi:MAG: Uncharacterized protein Greene041619_620 [Candidatus Peregrinibacteria bacterium Greene0416_19]|nr:MAG: Uncharacterized protein Greene041619_620 [Candidatus Peregrinibacteria bacterium Greene0416_19]
MSPKQSQDQQKFLPSAEPTFSVAKVPEPSKATTFEEWHATIKQNFPELATAVEVSMSVVTQLLIRDVTNCFALVLVDSPAAGKTIAINIFDEIEKITYSSDTFTPASFVSNAANVKKENLPKLDLLTRIRRHMFLVRDMATIFSARDDDLMKNLGILTRVLDGEGLSTDTGIHGRRTLRGDYVFMMLAASTPISPRVWKAMGTLGQRIFFLGLHLRRKTAEELAHQLKDTSYKSKELECRKVTREFLHTLWHQYPQGVEWNKQTEDDSLLKVVSRCSVLLARLRGQVIVYKEKWEGDEKEFSHTVPSVEHENRINQCLYNIARGHALATGRTQLAPQDMRIVMLLAFDSAPGHRAPLFHELIRKGGELKTSDVTALLNCVPGTAHKEMRTFVILGICEEAEGDTLDTSNHIRLKEDLRWFLGEECKRYLEGDTGSDFLKPPLSNSDAVSGDPSPC